MITKDLLWKSIIEDLFADFLLYFFYEWAIENVDFTKDFEFLDAELAELEPDSSTKKRNADRLVKIHLKNGAETWMLLHIEVQGYTDNLFAERMFIYFYRIKDKFKKDVMAFALYSDEDADFHPKQYEYVYQKTFLSYQFDTFKLLEKTEDELNIPNNPFSIVMRCARKAIDKKQKLDGKQALWKLALAKELLEAGFSEERTHNIMEFVRFYINFDKKPIRDLFEIKFNQLQNVYIPMSTSEYVTQERIAEGEARGEIRGEIRGQTRGETRVLKLATFNMLKAGFPLENIANILQQQHTTIETWKKEWENLK